MKVFVASQEGQGKRVSDFFFCQEGELVNVGFECDNDRNLDIDAGCGCQRSMVGFESRKGCTTFTVDDRAISEGQYIKLFRESMYNSGFGCGEDEEEKEALRLLRIAQRFEVGAVLEKRGSKIQVREI